MGVAVSFYICSFIASLFSPFIGFVAITCSVLIRFQDRYPDIVQIKPFTLLLTGMLLGCYINRDKLVNLKWKQDKLLLYFLVIVILGLLLQEPGDLIPETWSFICSLAFYFFASRILQKESQFVILFLAMAGCITYMGYEAIQSTTLFPKTSPFLGPEGRWQGLGYYANANEFGQLMITTVPFMLAVVLLRKSFLLSLLSLGMAILMVFVMSKTLSRTCMVALAVMLILTFALRGSGNVVKKVIVAGIVGMLLIGALSFVPGPVQERFNSIFEAGSDSSFQGRIRSWGYGFDMLSWYPITGVGKGQWLEYHGLMPHNSYVQVMAELGIFGIFVFLWIIWLTMKEFKPILLPETGDPPKKKRGKRPLNQRKSSQLSLKARKKLEKDKAPQPAIAVSASTKTIAIATVTTTIGYLLYILLGNQAYSVWTYFYLGICAAVRHLIMIPEPKTRKRFVPNRQTVATKTEMIKSGTN